jgi:hypothetical protein
MGVGYKLVNVTKKEIVRFFNLPVEKRGEICLHHVASKIVTMYMIDNMGNEISFVPDQYYEEDWPLRVGMDEVKGYREVTEELLQKAEKEGFIKGRKKVFVFEDDPNMFYWEFDPSEY